MLEFKKELITPAIAEKYLQANVLNRNIKKPIVELYAREMSNGRWKEDTAETIKISKTGIILDGQHRLLAVIKSNTNIWFYVATNLDDNVFDVLDTGSKRNSTDAFKISGVPNNCAVPSMISMFNFLRTGKKCGIQVNDKSTNNMLLSQYYEDVQFWNYVANRSIAWYSSFAKILPTSLIGGIFARILKLNEQKAKTFMEQLCTGYGINNNTIVLLRNRLMQDKVSLRRMNQTTKIALIIKTWNAFLDERSIKTLKFNPDVEEFPTFNK